jgi:hypothetical protein
MTVCCFILTVISVFSKYVFTQRLRDKRGQTVANAFDRIFALITPLMNISTDRGNKFYNRHVTEVFEKCAINYFSPHYYTAGNAPYVSSFNNKKTKTLNVPL